MLKPALAALERGRRSVREQLWAARLSPTPCSVTRCS